MIGRIKRTPRKTYGRRNIFGLSPLPEVLKCGLPFNAKGPGTHARTCIGTRPSRTLEPTMGGLPEDEGVKAVGEREEPSTASPYNRTHREGGRRAENSEQEGPSPGFLAPLIAVGRRSSMMSPATIPQILTPGSVATQALQSLMLDSPGGEETCFQKEMSLYNVSVKRRRFRLPNGSFQSSKGSRGRVPLADPIPSQVLAPSLQRLRPLCPLPETAPPPPSGWMPRELRGSGAL